MLHLVIKVNEKGDAEEKQALLLFPFYFSKCKTDETQTAEGGGRGDKEFFLIKSQGVIYIIVF